MPARPDPDEECPGCGVKYKNFRTGLSFSGVQEMMWVHTDDREQWVNKRRHTVLGKWMEMKIDMWNAHHRECAPNFDQTPEEIEAEIPF